MVNVHAEVIPMHQVFHMDSNPGALLGLLVLLLAAVGGLVSSMLRQDGKLRASMYARRASFGGVALYVTAVIVISLATPRTIVSIGDGYCYDTWCIGVLRVNAVPHGTDVLYTADVRVFSDANRVPAHRGKDFLYVLDEHGRRFPLLSAADVTVMPHESLTTSVTFLAPANSRKLYLTGGYPLASWVAFYLGSDIAPFHRRTLLRVL